MNQTEEFRRQPPAPLAPKPLSIREPYETVLGNGLQVVVVEDKRLPLVSYRLALHTGDAHDPKDAPGLTDMVANMLNEGTASRTSRQIADEVARIGATLSAGANSDYTIVAASALSAYGDQILDLMADIALRPSFPENELELVKQNTKQGLIQQRAQAAFLANETLSRVLFGPHPYGVIAPTPESVDAMTRQKLVDFHRAMFVPDNAVLIAVGDIEREAFVQRVSRLFGEWEGEERPGAEEDFPAPPEREARAIYLVDRPGSLQSNIVIADLGLTRTSPDYFPMLLLHTILGGNASSRLFMNLREEKGYTYGAYSNLDTRRAAGTLRATAEVRTPVTGASLKEFFYELDRIRSEAVSEKELADAKAYLTGVFPIRLETQEGLTDQQVQIKMFDLPADYLQTYRDRVNAVTADDIQRVARRYVTTDRAAIVIVGDASAIIDQAKPYAETIEVYDASGNRKEMSFEGRGVSASGGGAGAEATADLAGTWSLEVTAPGGQPLHATLTLKQDGRALTGSIRSQMGDASLNDATVNGNSFNGSLSLTMFGQAIDAQITGNALDDRMDGSLGISMPGAPPLPFTGTRAKPK